MTAKRDFLKKTAGVTVAPQSYGARSQPTKIPFKRIAVEEAYVTQAIADEWKKIIAAGSPEEPGFRKMGETILADSPGTRIIHQRLVNLDAGRIAEMDANNIDMQLVSITSPGVQVFQPDLATELARDANDHLSAAVKRYPDRFAGLAALAPQMPEQAALELERSMKSLGMKGALINSHTFGEYLDEVKYRPILEAANALKAPIYLHPRTPSPGMIEPYLDYGLYFAGWGFAAETGVHAMRLIMSGVFDQFPDLKIAIGHMGEGIPFYLQRIDNRYLLQVKIGALKALKRLPSEYFKDHFVITTSGVVQESSLQLSLQELGVDGVLFAADYPYENMAEQVAFMDSAMMSDADRHKVYHGNAERIFNLS